MGYSAHSNNWLPNLIEILSIHGKEAQDHNADRKIGLRNHPVA